MLEAGGDEGGDWQQHARDLVAHRASRIGEPHAQADQDVAHDPLEEDRRRVGRNLADGEFEQPEADIAAVEVREMAHPQQEHETERPNEVADPDDGPVLDDL